jgi:predicted DNA binding CopG/RHH family protein
MARVTSRKHRLPAFRTDEEERAFWKTHRPGDYVEALGPERVQVSRSLRDRVRERKKNLTLRMEPSRVQEIKAVARSLGLPYQTLMRMWIIERLRRARAEPRQRATPSRGA